MKNLKLTRHIACSMAVMIIVSIISGCQKMPKADKYNEYRDGVPNPPSSEGAPIIGSVYPLTGVPNTVVTLAGINIDPVIANNSVTVNGAPAVVNSVAVSSIPGALPKVTVVFTVPLNATSGKIVLKTKGVEVAWVTDFKVLTADVSTYADLGNKYIEHIAFDKDGIAYGDDVNTIYRISQTGQVTNFIAPGADNPFKFIWGVAVDNFNDVFVPDALDRRIYKVSPAGVPKVYTGNGLDGVVDGTGSQIQFGAPRGIAKDMSGNLYITDVHRVRKLASNGVMSTLAGSAVEGYADGKGAAAQFGSLDGIAVDTSGNIYVSDRRFLNIRKITPDGTVTTLAGSGQPGFTDGPGNPATFSDPRGLATDVYGNVYVADQNKTTATHAIRVINKLGNVTTFIKGTSNTGVINGPSSTASVNSPNGLAFGADNNLYIVNTGANIVSKVTFK